jgi:hypothetical protein
LLAEGWGPLQLATELVDDLRQAFLAALAPDLCAVSGPQRSELSTLAKSMGLARVVRSMEILGRALVDMRDAPDAQVVLEIAAVRAARPDLDLGTAALAERVSALERAVAAGGHSAPQPDRAEPAGPAVTEPSPAAAVTRRPSVGAVRRRGSDPAPSVTEPETSPRPESMVVTMASGTEAEPGGEAAPAVDRDTLTQAWGDGILHSLSARAKALYSAGRFVAVDSGCVQFALPNAAHRERCLELASQVEAALTERFETPLRLVLVLEGGQGSPPNGASSPPEIRGASIVERQDELEDQDPEQFEAAPMEAEHQASAVDRLLQAFPGASEIEE